jgi:NTE family protein
MLSQETFGHSHAQGCERRKAGLVLAGGGARAAYEVGVIHYLVHDVARDLGCETPLDILSGTSAGAINACGLAAFADEPRRRADRLADQWRALSIEQVLRLDGRELAVMALGLANVQPKSGWCRPARGGLINPSGLARIVGSAIPFDRIASQVRAGRLSALTLSATHVATGKTTVFIHGREGTAPSWRDATVEPRAAIIGLEHVLASAAIPFLFPAVPVDGQLYCDGALRQNVPLSPARRLGADALIIVSPNHTSSTSPALALDRERSLAGPAFLLGKTLNALLLDRLDGDVDRLNRINLILEAGAREYGPGFVDALNRQLGGTDFRPLRPVQSVVVRPSQNLSVLGARFLESAKFRRKGGLSSRFLRRFVGHHEEADLASYLLFDGGFADELIELGRADARASHAELMTAFQSVIESRSQASAA